MKIETTIGVDLHKHQLNTAVLDEGGRILERRELATRCRKQIAEYFGSYGGRAQVAVESVGFCQWFWDLVRPQVGALHLADPAGVRAHAGRKAKTDRNDALLLATLLRDQRLPMAYVPREPVRQLREMVRHRHSLAKTLAGERRSLRWLALKNNLPGPTSFTSERAQKWLLSVEPKLSAVHRVAARQRLDHIIALERDVWDVEQEIDRMAEADAELMRQIALMETVPGIGRLTAVTIVAETGDITRFDNIDQLGAYAGLVPRGRLQFAQGDVQSEERRLLGGAGMALGGPAPLAEGDKRGKDGDPPQKDRQKQQDDDQCKPRTPRQSAATIFAMGAFRHFRASMIVMTPRISTKIKAVSPRCRQLLWVVKGRFMIPGRVSSATIE